MGTHTHSVRRSSANFQLCDYTLSVHMCADRFTYNQIKHKNQKEKTDTSGAAWTLFALMESHGCIECPFLHHLSYTADAVTGKCYNKGCHLSPLFSNTVLDFDFLPMFMGSVFL